MGLLFLVYPKFETSYPFYIYIYIYIVHKPLINNKTLTFSTITDLTFLDPCIDIGLRS
jgi:hypothetical protein